MFPLNVYSLVGVLKLLQSSATLILSVVVNCVAYLATVPFLTIADELIEYKANT